MKILGYALISIPFLLLWLFLIRVWGNWKEGTLYFIVAIWLTALITMCFVAGATLIACGEIFVFCN